MPWILEACLEGAAAALAARSAPRSRLLATAALFAALATGLAAPSGALGDPGAEPDPPLVIAALRPAHVPGDLVQQALPPAPHLVVRKTGYYGNVTIDHRAHLALRISCKACHGPGPVGKLEFTPRVAHERCVGCHRVAQARRPPPTDCKGCHVMPPADAPPVVAAATAAATPIGQPLAAALPVQLATAGAGSDELRPGSLRRTVGIGGCAAGFGFGPAFHLSSRHGGAVLEHSVDRLSGSDEVRTNVLVGGGVARPLRRDLDLVAVGLGGIDVAERPGATVMPALGGRVGVEWAPPRSWVVHSVRFSVTGVVDLANRDSLGRDVGGTHVYATLATGFRLGAVR